MNIGLLENNKTSSKLLLQHIKATFGQFGEPAQRFTCELYTRKTDIKPYLNFLVAVCGTKQSLARPCARLSDQVMRLWATEVVCLLERSWLQRRKTMTHKNMEFVSRFIGKGCVHLILKTNEGSFTPRRITIRLSSFTLENPPCAMNTNSILTI